MFTSCCHYIIIVLFSNTHTHFTLYVAFIYIFYINVIALSKQLVHFLMVLKAFGSCICFEEQFLSCDSLRPIRYYHTFFHYLFVLYILSIFLTIYITNKNIPNVYFYYLLYVQQVHCMLLPLFHTIELHMVHGDSSTLCGSLL